MANEAQIVELINGGEIIDVTVADGTGIEMNTIIKLADPRTGSATSGSGDIVLGIAASEKVANDTHTNLGVYTHCIADLVVASGASVTVGQYVSTSGANVIKTATEAEIAAGKALGRALETGSDSERIEVLVRI